MNETIQFRNCVIRHFQSPPLAEGVTPFVRLHVAVDFSSPSNESMGWTDPASCGVNGVADLIGDLSQVHAVLTPHDPEMEKFEIQLDAHEVADFKLHTVKDEDHSGREVRFIMRINSQGAAAILENYRWMVGDRPALLKLSYSKAEQPGSEVDDRQSGLDFDGKLSETDEAIANVARADHGPVTDEELLAEFGDGNTDCVSCNGRVPHSPGNPTMHVTGHPCARTAGSTLASASTVTGTHQKRGRPRKPLDIPEQTEPEDEPTILQ